MANLHSTRLEGNLVYWDTHRKRLVDAFGPDVVKYIEDFVGVNMVTAELGGEWDITRVEAGAGESTIAVIDGVGGIARITTDAAENDGVNAQLVGEAFELTADQDLYCGFFGVKLSDATESDLFLGLCITDTDILGGATDSIGFRKVDGSTDLTFVVEKNSTETVVSGLHTLVDATAVDLEFYYNGSTLEVFVNGVSVATPAVTNLPNDEFLRLSWHFLAGAAAAKTCDVDKIVCIMIGR